MRLLAKWSNGSQPAPAAPSRTEARVHGRFKIRYPVQLLLPSGRRMPVCTLDVSATGVLVESLLPIKIGSVVRVRATDVPMLCGIATVRYCARRGLTYRISLEFEAPFNRRF